MSLRSNCMAAATTPAQHRQHYQWQPLQYRSTAATARTVTWASECVSNPAQPASVNESKLMAAILAQSARELSYFTICPGPGRQTRVRGRLLHPCKVQTGSPPQAGSIGPRSNDSEPAPAWWQPESLVPATAGWPERAYLQFHVMREK